MLNNFVLTDLHGSSVNGVKPHYSVSDDVSSYSDKKHNFYNSLNGIKPIDDEIDMILYMDNYMEKGVSIKPSIDGFRQMWLDYRDMYENDNEKKESSDIMYSDIYDINSDESKAPIMYGLSDDVTNSVTNNSFILDNFDEIYDRLTERVMGANKHIDDLKLMRENLNNTSDELDLEKKSLEQEKREFDMYRDEQIKFINDEKRRIEDNSKKLQDLIDGFEEKLNTIL